MEMIEGQEEREGRPCNGAVGWASEGEVKRLRSVLSDKTAPDLDWLDLASPASSGHACAAPYVARSEAAPRPATSAEQGCPQGVLATLGARLKD